MLICNSHKIGDEEQRTGRNIAGNIEIGDGCWIGSRAVVLKDVCVGKGCVIGAMSLVSRSIPDNSLAVGVPCKVIKSLPEKM